MDGSLSPDRTSNIKLDKDQEMFIYRWFPIMGGLYCAKQLGIHPDTVRGFANDMGIPRCNRVEVMPIREIAERLNMTELEVRQCLNSAMCKLREEFKRRQLDE